MLGWNDTIATAGAESLLREGPRLAGTVEDQDQQLLILRIAGGLLQVEVDDGPGSIRPGTSVVMVVDDLKLYPTGT